MSTHGSKDFQESGKTKILRDLARSLGFESERLGLAVIEIFA